jgi:5'(3')-deoxyribonucleotidase
MTIVLDLDDVLANLRESLYQILTSATGVDLHWQHWTHYDLRQHYRLVENHLDKILIDAQVLEQCQPEPGAGKITHALRRLGFEVAIVTARGWHPQATAITRTWLQSQNISYDHLHVVPLGGNKLEVFTQLQDVVMAVDDHPDNITRYHAKGILSLLMDRPWNKHFSGERIFSLDAIIDYAGNLQLSSPTP